MAELGVRKVVLSSVTPPIPRAMLVVFPPSVRFEELNMSNAPPLAPTSIQEETALQVVILVPYSKRSAVFGEVIEPSFEISVRRRT